MPNPFTSVEKTSNDVRRNVWDWSHSNNFTTEIGKITPVFCERVPAGTSLSINARYALQFMPMMFPIQNHIKARISFFKMPVRALWKNYRDWISTVNQTDTEGASVNSKYIPPYISISSDKSDSAYSEFENYFGTRSLADYLGLPTEVSGAASDSSFSRYTCIRSTSSISAGVDLNELPCITTGAVQQNLHYFLLVSKLYSFSFTSPFEVTTSLPSSFLTAASLKDVCIKFAWLFLDASGKNVVSNIPYSSVRPLSDFLVGDSYVFHGSSCQLSVPSPCTVVFLFQVDSGTPLLTTSYLNVSTRISYTGIPYTPDTCPWFNRYTNQGLRISSLPWRMYEAVYNAFYRNNRNNPLIIDGLKRYNTWTSLYDFDGDDTVNIRSLSVDSEFSSDDYFYGFKYINWEPDEYTTAVQSPQEGVAPLVGLTVYSSSASGTPSLVNQITDEDGNTYNVKLESDENGLTGVEYSKTDVLTDGTPVTSVYAGVTQGISINDFRLVNAYQRYLELNMRRGYSYKDIIEGRYDVNVRFSDLLLPEFLGGFTRQVGINPVTQTTPTDESGSYQGSLGSQAGQAFLSGSSDNNVTCFCDEDSIVLGLLTVSPDSIYTQTLPKHFLIRNPLDIFSPEYANIGFQPITLAEVAPIQVFNYAGGIDTDMVFGYQRPWADLIHKHNTAHGLFRTQLKNFLMHRTFGAIPRLSKEFLLCKPTQVNDVFSVTETSDKIFGQVYFDIKCKNGVPRNNLPRLE